MTDLPKREDVGHYSPHWQHPDTCTLASVRGQVGSYPIPFREFHHYMTTGKQQEVSDEVPARVAPTKRKKHAR